MVRSITSTPPTAYLIIAVSDDGAIPMITARALTGQSREHRFFVTLDLLSDVLPVPYMDILLVWPDDSMMLVSQERYDAVYRNP